MNVGWTRGHGCQALAELLSSDAVAIPGDLRRGVIDAKLELLVTKKLSSFDLASVAVPESLAPDNIAAVVAAVAGGAHSPLAADVAATAARSLGVPITLATVYRPEEKADAEARLEKMAEHHPGVKTDAIAATSVRALLDDVDRGTLLVVGAPGGSWLNRQLFGPGHRLLSASDGGTITVRYAERRVFHDAVDAKGFALGPDLPVSVADSVMAYPVVPVADGGVLVGILRRGDLVRADQGVRVADVMEDPVSLRQDEPRSAANDLTAHMEGCPIPVTDSAGRLVGVVGAV